MAIRWVAVVAAMLAFAVLGPASAQEAPVGYVKVSGGSATIERAGVVLPANPGTAVLVGDVCATGADGTLGVTLLDGTRIGLGPDTRFTVSSFAFDPARDQLGFAGRLARGTIEFISGLIAKLAPGAATVETPVANIVVRGTRVLIRAGEP